MAFLFYAANIRLLQDTFSKLGFHVVDEQGELAECSTPHGVWGGGYSVNSDELGCGEIMVTSEGHVDDDEQYGQSVEDTTHVVDSVEDLREELQTAELEEDGPGNGEHGGCISGAYCNVGHE